MNESLVPMVAAPTILLVEDNELVMELTCDVLQNSGYKVVATYLPSVALNLVEQYNSTVDLLVTDVVMPQMNGPELYHHMRKRLPALPVLYMSGYSGESIREIMQEEKVHFISKPFKPNALLERVAHVLTSPF